MVPPGWGPDGVVAVRRSPAAGSGVLAVHRARKGAFSHVTAAMPRMGDVPTRGRRPATEQAGGRTPREPGRRLDRMSEPFASTTGPDDPFGEPGGSTSVLERTETTEQVEPGDHERFAHYVRKNKVLESALNGTPVIALCGKVWVPGRDPNKFPV